MQPTLHPSRWVKRVLYSYSILFIIFQVFIDPWHHLKECWYLGSEKTQKYVTRIIEQLAKASRLCYWLASNLNNFMQVSSELTKECTTNLHCEVCKHAKKAYIHVQSNLFNTDTKGTEPSVGFTKVSQYYRCKECMIFGISGTKHTIHNGKVSVLQRCP